MKKIMHVIHGLNTGGAETLVKDYALNLDKSKFDIVILCFDHIKESPYEKLLKDNNIKVIYVCDYMKYYNKKCLLFKLINHVEKYHLIKKIIHKEKPDVLHTHLPVNSYIKYSRPTKGTKIIHTVHNEPKKLWNLNIKSRKKDFYAARWLVKKYNMSFITLHDEMRKEVNELFNVNNSVVLNNGISINRFNKSIAKEDIRNKLGIPNDCYIIGHVGRFTKQKNHEFIVDVFNEIHKKRKNTFLLLVGSGVEKKNIIDKLHGLKLDSNYMILENRKDIPELLNAMDCFIFPSIFEGLGISFIEAQIARIPCFISNNVPRHAIISNMVVSLPLSLSCEEWSENIINYKKPEQIIVNDEGWDIANVVDNLEKMYSVN